jgi:hypothetical protein
VSNTILEVNGPSCVAEEFQGEVVALNTDTGSYFSMRGNSAALWQDLCAGHTVETLVASAGPDTPMAAAIQSFANQAVSEGLLRPAAATPEHLASPAFASNGELPALEIYHDMQSLLLLDPVHEVDEQRGWPKARNG